ncbi:MAG: hypothetical protein K5872_05255 [Rhizobiaceae bacterium]|nr:hypothetical protein [Rhizobiaceae bacterium]MCV0405618.1 hypothetical protein [Rhizobiaceae bacterium]
MAFKVDPNVKRIKSYSKTYTRVGHNPGGKYIPHEFQVGAFSFSTPYSATVFAYLFKKVGITGAQNAVKELEQQMEKIGILERIVKLIIGDLQGKALEMIPGVATYNKINDIVDKAGAVYISIKLEGDSKGTAQYNPYDPSNDAKRYAQYAIAFWKKYKDGPAYELQRDSVREKDKKDQFNPFGW